MCVKMNIFIIICFLVFGQIICDGAVIGNVSEKLTEKKLDTVVPTSQNVISNLNENTEQHQECLEDLEETNEGPAFSSQTPTVKHKRCPSESRLGAALNPNQVTMGTRSNIPKERRDLKEQICDNCKTLHKCQSGDSCPKCDIYCKKTLPYPMPSRRTSEGPISSNLAPKKHNALLLPMVNRLGDANVGVKQDRKETNDSPENSEDVLIIGAANGNSENLLPPLAPPSSSVLGVDQNLGEKPVGSIQSRFGSSDDEDAPLNIYLIKILESADPSLRNWLHLFGVRETSDISKVWIWATTKSGQPPIMLKNNNGKYPITLDNLPDYFKEALQKALMRKDLPTESDNVGLSHNLDDTISPRLPMEPEGIVIPQSANPDIIEGPPDMNAIQEARLADDMEPSASDRKFNLAVPDSYLGWSKNGGTPTKIDLPIENEAEGEMERTSLPESTPDLVSRIENEPVFQTVDTTNPEPITGEQNIGLERQQNQQQQIIGSELKQQRSDESPLGKLPSPQNTFNTMMDNFRNTQNRKLDENNNDRGSMNDQLTEPEPTFFVKKKPKLPIIKLPKPFKYPITKFRSNDENNDETMLEKNEPEGSRDEVASVNRDEMASNIKEKILTETERKPTLKEMAQKMIEDYKARHQQMNKQLPTEPFLDPDGMVVEPKPVILEQAEESPLKQSINDEVMFEERNLGPAQGYLDNQKVLLNRVNEEAGKQTLEADNNRENVGSPNDITGDFIIKDEDGNVLTNDVDIENSDEGNDVPQSNIGGENQPNLLDSDRSLGRTANVNLIGLEETNKQRSEQLGAPNLDNLKNLLDAGPFTSLNGDSDSLKETPINNLDGNVEGSELASTIIPEPQKSLHNDPFVALRKELYDTQMELLKTKLEAAKNRNAEMKRLNSGGDFIGESKPELLATPQDINKQWITPNEAAINDFEDAQATLKKIQELSKKLEQDSKLRRPIIDQLRRPIDQQKLESFLSDIEQPIIANEANNLAGKNEHRATAAGDGSIVGSQPLENSWENLQPTIPRFGHQTPQNRDNTLVGDAAKSDNNTLDDGDAVNPNKTPMAARAQFNDPTLSTGLALKDQNDIALSLTNPKELYFVSNGDKLPLQISKKENGEIHLSVDVEKLCSCKNTSCPANHTADIEDTVGAILEKEAELKEELKPIVAAQQQQLDDVDFGGSTLGMAAPGIAQDGTVNLASRSFVDDSSILDNHTGGDLVNRNEREVTESKLMNKLSTANAADGMQRENSDIYRRSLQKNYESSESLVAVADDIKTQTTTLPNTKQLLNSHIPTESLAIIPTQTISVGDRTKLTPTNPQLFREGANYVKNFFSNLRSGFSSLTKPTNDNQKSQTPELFKNLFKFGDRESSAIPKLGERIRSFANSDENRDIKWPITNPFKFNNNNNLSSQLKKLEKIDKSVDEYVKENDKMIEEETKTILETNQDPATKKEVGIMSNILNWFRKIAKDRPKK